MFVHDPLYSVDEDVDELYFCEQHFIDWRRCVELVAGEEVYL